MEKVKILNYEIEDLARRHRNIARNYADKASDSGRNVHDRDLFETMCLLHSSTATMLELWLDERT